MKSCSVLCLFFALLLLPMSVFCKEISASTQAAEEWTVMPAGTRQSYLGIHGGTMPVSLLVSNDGANLFTFVGRTGNDFMEVLKKVHIPLPTLGNATWASPGNTYTGLAAGNATTSMPVRSISRDILQCQLQPFGLSDEPVSIEGQVTKPEIFPHARNLRIFVWPDFLRPEYRTK